MTDERQIARVTDYEGLVEAFRARVAELKLTNNTLDELAGLQPGYAGKLLGPARVKHFGPMSLDAMLGVLGIAIVLVEDPEVVARMQSRYEQRLRPAADAIRLSMALENKLRPQLLRKMASRGGKARLTKMTPAARRRVARKAARARWQKKPAKPKRSRAKIGRDAIPPVHGEQQGHRLGNVGAGGQALALADRKTKRGRGRLAARGQTKVAEGG